MNTASRDEKGYRQKELIALANLVGTTLTLARLLPVVTKYTTLAMLIMAAVIPTPSF